MRKSVVTFTSAALLLSGLTACTVGDRAAENRYYEETRPIGYYTSENNPNVNVNYNRTRRMTTQRGNAYRLDDNDGPLVEMMDRSVIYDGRRNTTMRNIGYNRPQFSRRDINYHGHLNGIRPVGDSSYYNNYQGDLTEQLAERASRVRGVEDVRAVVYGDEILVAVKPARGASARQVTRDVRRAVDPIVKGRDCRVVADDGTFNRIRNVDNDLRDGGPVERLNQDMRGLFNTRTR